MFEWKEEYCFNIAEIDKQHKHLLEIGKKLYDILTLKDEIDHYDEIVEILVELREYTIYHFTYEEKLLKQHGYEGLQLHKRQHKSFINKIIQFENQDIDEKQMEMKLKMMEFLADWIEQHILKSDHQYKDFLQEKGVY
ncbi:bacteriohemerythrin [Crassaminicella thermophila]|uniref:Bacteriohemerythrin n=1 Tax=Crassaminicella thermophila TaxID=2599308 RepID=A0A5C0SAC5_CRATE|nr:bacteriohemerythrin [Crassaminicella thermophila]QEK10892.1 bacteriohemerythrin [Crassaminicella thermophila]